MKLVKTINVTNEHSESELHAPTSLDWLGPIRMLVIAFIAFGYASTMPRGPEKAEYLRMFGYDPSWYGISVIFMMTGFLSLRSLRRHNSPLKFLFSRFGRNIPTLLIFALIVILAIFPIFAVAPEAGTSRLDQHLQYLVSVISCVNPGTLTPGLLDNALYTCVIQGGLWTFRWGAIAFIGTALLWGIGILRHNKIIAYLTIALTISFIVLMVYASKTPDIHPVLNFIITGLHLGWAYMFGMCLYAYGARLPRTYLIPLSLIGFAALHFYLIAWTPLIEISMELGLGYLCYLGITSKRPAPQWVRATPDISLGLYMFNWPATQITLLLIPTLTPLPLFAIAFPVTVLISLCVWGLVSRKINIKLAQKLALS